ncbi:MAG: GNAT family N-acetyltransferase [Ferruginibacter sp.]
MAIRYVPYKQIDKAKWDACIEKAGNRLVYAFSFYLDAMAKHWDALVMDDYDCVMPLTWNRKYGFCYLYQPPFTASLGVFGKKITASLVGDFLKSIPSKFRYIDIYLNHADHFKLNEFQLYERVNYVLSLNESYEDIYKNYRDNIKRNIKKSLQLNCVVKKDFEVGDVIAVAKEQFNKTTSLTDVDYGNFRKLYTILQQQGKAVVYGVFAAAGQLLASAVFFVDDERAYYILVGNHPNGKTLGASHALIDAFIKDHAGTALILDFEGSDIRSLAFFYSSFGAKEEIYPGLKINRLPGFMKFFKK